MSLATSQSDTRYCFSAPHPLSGILLASDKDPYIL